MLLRVGGDIEDSVKTHAFQFVSKLCSVAFNILCSVRLSAASAVQYINLVAVFDKVLCGEFAYKCGSACD